WCHEPRPPTTRRLEEPAVAVAAAPALGADASRWTMTPSPQTKSAPRAMPQTSVSQNLCRRQTSAVRSVTVVQTEDIVVAIVVECLVTDAGVDDVVLELHAAGLEFGAGGGDVVDAERDRVVVGAELDPERIGLHDGDRQRAGLELGRRHLPPALGKPQTEHV